MTAPPPETRVDLRTVLAGLGALLLLIGLFLDWYGDPVGHDAINAWESFELVDVILAVLALAVLYEIVRGFSRSDWPTASMLTAFAGPVALLLVLVSLIDDPPLAAFVEADLEVGIWLALAGAVLMTIAAFVDRVRISVVTTPRQPPPPPPPPPPHDPDAATRTLA